MLIRTGFDIVFELAQDTPMIALLSMRPERQGDVRTPEVLRTDPPIPVHTYLDSFGNLASRFVAPAGSLHLSSDFIIEDPGQVDPFVPDAQQHPVEELPDETILYLLGSRYCEVDLLAGEAWEIAGPVAGGWAKVQALVDAAHERLGFNYGTASDRRTARMAWDERAGVCRDFAHLAITLCRAVNIPARYCTGYLVDFAGGAFHGPMDFSAWFEAYIGGRWYPFDARHNHIRHPHMQYGRLKMAQGRDATDVALTTSFGRAPLTRFEVHTNEVLTTDLTRHPRETALRWNEDDPPR